MTNRRIPLARRLAAAAFLLVVLVGTAPAQAVQFRNGLLVVGEVRQVSTAGFVFGRFDNGGTLELTWDDLTPVSAQRIKRMHGLIDESEEAFQIEADVVTFQSGPTIQVLVGLLDLSGDKEVELRRKGYVTKIPRRNIKEISKRQVGVYEVYTEDGFYEEKLAEAAPGTDPDKHVELAETLRRAGDVRRALVHLERAEELGGGRYGSELPGRLANVRRLAEAEEERKALAEIGVSINRRDFVAATEAIEAFRDAFPEPRLGTELAREERRLERERIDFLTRQIVSKFEGLTRAVATEKLASDRELSLEGAKTYAQNAMARDLWERYVRVLSSRDVEIDATEIEELWGGRSRLQQVRGDYYAYGIGSWVLGPEVILKDTDVQKATERASERDDRSSAERDSDELAAKLRRLNQEAQRRRQTGAQELKPEDWWENATRNEKIEWLQAYFVEFGSGAEILKAFAVACYNCAAKGTIPVQTATGEPTNAPCPVCHGTRFTRAFRAR
jgi:hypothetical protein